MSLRWIALTIAIVAAGPALAHQTAEQRLEAVGFEQRIGAAIPAGAGLVDAGGAAVSLPELGADKPVILVLSWFECPDLCPMVLDRLAETLAELSFAGRGYELAVVSIDPGESPAEARVLLDRLEAQHGSLVKDWHFLSGGEEAIARVASAVGFQYAYDGETDSYAHAAGLVVLAPGARVAQYLFRLQPDEPDLRLALMEASRGELGSVVDQVLLRCYRFDPDTGQYSLAIGRLMQVAGGVSLLCIGVWILRLRRREKT